MYASMETIWHRALDDPSLQELPHKIESNEHGQLVLSVHTPRHGLLQSRINDLLNTHAPAVGPRAVTFPVRTAEGIKVPDVIWMSTERFASVPSDVKASPVLPEIVVEVVADRETEEGMREKRMLYLQEGADEVWTCGESGAMTFYSEEGPIEYSALAPSFPGEVD